MGSISDDFGGFGWRDGFGFLGGLGFGLRNGSYSGRNDDVVGVVGLLLNVSI